MDKHPEMFAQRLYREDPLKLNKDFTFNSSGIPCDSDKFILWTKEGLFHLQNNVPSCQSKTGRKISGFDLWTLLLRDMGFKGRKHIPADYLGQ